MCLALYPTMWIDAKNRMCSRSKKGYFNSTGRTIIMLLCRPDIIAHLFKAQQFCWSINIPCKVY